MATNGKPRKNPTASVRSGGARSATNSPTLHISALVVSLPITQALAVPAKPLKSVIVDISGERPGG